MPQFEYKARDRSGSVVDGSIEATERRAAIQQLQAKGLTPVTLSESRAGPADSPLSGWLRQLKSLRAAGTAKSAPADQAGGSKAKREKVGLAVLKRLIELHGSGLPAGDSIRILSQRLSEKEQKTLANQLWRDLSEGATLAGAMARQPKYFSSSVCYVVEAGEATGNLAPILRKVIEYLEEKQAIRQKMLASMSYPGFICVVAIGVMILFITVLLPMIEKMTSKLGGEIPLIAKIIIGGADLAATFGPFALVALVVGLISLFQWRRSEKGRRTTDAWVFRLPIFGGIAHDAELFQMSSLIGTLMGSGINTTESLRLTERTIGNLDLRARFHEARSQVNEGLSIAQAFHKNRIMPALSLDILAVGEDTGNLASSIEEITKSFRETLSLRTARMITLITSVALGSAFLFVGLVAVAMVVSVLGISQSL
jgi:type II secretory pathway component PulF